MNQKTLLFTTLALIVSVGVARQAFAQDEAGSGDFIKSRTYFGFYGTSATLDQWGDFTGTLAFTSNSSGTTAIPEVDYVPSIERNFGWAALVGHREGPWAAEISFWRSDHTATYSGTSVYTMTSGTTITTPASLQSIDIDFKRYFFTQLPTQLFVNVGLDFPWLWVRQFSFVTYSTPLVDDETISGIGFSLGAGAEIYLDNGFSITGGIFQRWTGFNQINGAAKIAENNLYLNGDPSKAGTLEGDGFNIYVGTTFGVQ